jgi:hypothetical protein
MRRMKAAVPAFVAVCAISALASSPTFAAENPEVLFGAGITEEKSTGEGGSATLSTLAGTTITCKKVTGEGTIKAREGTVHADFKECTGPLGVQCTGLGEAAGVILVLKSVLLVFDSLTPLGVAGLQTLSAGVHFTCFGILFEILKGGKDLCLGTPINTAAKHFEGKCELTNNDPKETTYWENNAMHTLTAAEGLLLQENHSSEEDAAFLGTGLGLTKNNITVDG